ncbi:MAG: hypothetical protein O9267_07370 [Flavobacterium sp.]|uniref:hypothetical protein n=1 Tax=Flavobacterium sp. TaxID=239 RepID=UPI0022C27B05|nr:hypothetical protein [Flavobacterium sp.]MCZ8197410.1 hypothetical protein [Flavobacterium sp.]
MKKILYNLVIVFSLTLNSCSSSDEETSNNSTSTIAQEIDPAKTFYANNGTTFKYRLYRDAPIEGNNDNFNNHSAEIYKIIDDNGIFSVFAGYSLPAIGLAGYGAVLNCQGDYNKESTTNNVFLQSTSANDDFEIDTNYTRLISYNSTSGAHGSFGFVGTRIYVHSPNFFSGAISASSNQGYMHTINHANFMLSMGYNSDGGLPRLYRYNPTNFSWLSYPVPGIEVVPGSGTNIPLTNDSSKVGNADKVFWAWLSYTSNLSNGKINIISYDGSTFSNVTSLDGIGSIGSGWASVNTITLHKNPNNLNNPYMVVRRYNSDILDIYKFNGTTIEVVKIGVSIPTSIPITSGSIRTFKELKFTGDNVYLIWGFDKNLYKLSGSTFVVDRPNLTLSGEKISAIEGSPNGLLVSIVKAINTKPQPKTVSDVILIPNN